MRTDNWRFVEWTKRGEQPVWELYDSLRDPQNDVNLAARPENRELLTALSTQLRERFPVQEFRPSPAASGKKSPKKQPQTR